MTRPISGPIASPSRLPRRRPHTLAFELVEALGEQIRQGRLRPGDKLPTEASLMADHGVSRTVVREALSRLQASGLVSTRHGVGTFVDELKPVAGEPAGFRIAADQMATLRDVVAVLELRIGVETEAAGLAAQRRSDADLVAMRAALDSMAAALEAGDDAVAADFQFHLEVSRATRNPHFEQLMAALGSAVIPRSRLRPAPATGTVPAGAAGGLAGVPAAADTAERQAYLRRVQFEHESILEAIAAQDPDAARAAMRTHLGNSRERRRRAALLADS